MPKYPLNDRCKNCNRTIHPVFEMDCPVYWHHGHTQERTCYIGHAMPIAEPEQKEEPVKLYPPYEFRHQSIQDQEKSPAAVYFIPSDLRLNGTELLKKFEEVFSSKTYSKKQYTREELHDIFVGFRTKFEDASVTGMMMTNPDWADELTCDIHDTGAGWAAMIEGRRITGFVSEAAATEFVDEAKKNPMMWRD